MHRRRTILLAEDDENDSILVQRAFADAGWCEPLQVVRDGCETMRYLAGEGVFGDRKAHPFPTVLLLDLKMGLRGGLDVLRWLRQERPDLRRRLIVIILSALDSPEALKTAYELGANSYLLKPFAFEGLVALAGSVKAYWLELNHPLVE